MSQESWQIEFFTTSRGTSPVIKFLDKLEPSARAKVDNFLKLLREFGPHLSLPHAEPLKGHKPLWELKPRPVRLFYFLYGGQRFVLLHAFFKKKNKTDRKEIRTAERRLAEFLEREDENG